MSSKKFELLLIKIMLMGGWFVIDSHCVQTFTKQKTEERMLMALTDGQVGHTELSCGHRCAHTNQCTAFTYNSTTGTCTLGYVTVPSHQSTHGHDVKLYSTGLHCKDAEMVYGDYISCCQQPLIGQLENTITTRNMTIKDPLSPTIYRSCRDVVSSEPRPLVRLASGLVVMCDTQTDGGGWTVIQRRVSGVVDFYRDWDDYRRGFGDYFLGDFYLGNENIHCISSKSDHVLRFDMKYLSNNYYATYTNFSLTGENDGYRLKVGAFSGNTGDSILSGGHANQRFSTFDRDNDVSPDQCAIKYHGAWWYSSCHAANLNGQWMSTSYASGVIWFPITGHYNSLNFTEMKIRPFV